MPASRHLVVSLTVAFLERVDSQLSKLAEVFVHEPHRYRTLADRRGNPLDIAVAQIARVVGGRRPDGGGLCNPADLPEGYHVALSTGLHSAGGLLPGAYVESVSCRLSWQRLTSGCGSLLRWPGG
jgi:hypothetical protein